MSIADLPELSRSHSPCRGQRAANQNYRVESTEVLVKKVVSKDKDLGMVCAINRVSDEETAEKQDLGGEKDPHSELGRLVLLVSVLEMMVERQTIALTVGIFGHQLVPFPEARIEAGSLRT